MRMCGLGALPTLGARPSAPRSPRSAPLWPHLRRRARPRASGGRQTPASVAWSSPGLSRLSVAVRSCSLLNENAPGCESPAERRTPHTPRSFDCGSHSWGAEMTRVVGAGWVGVFPWQSEHLAWGGGGRVPCCQPTAPKSEVTQRSRPSRRRLEEKRETSEVASEIAPGVRGTLGRSSFQARPGPRPAL